MTRYPKETSVKKVHWWKAGKQPREWKRHKEVKIKPPPKEMEDCKGEIIFMLSESLQNKKQWERNIYNPRKLFRNRNGAECIH